MLGWRHFCLLPGVALLASPRLQAGLHACGSALSVAGLRRDASCSPAKFLMHVEILQELRADAAAPVDRKGAGAVALSGHQGEHQDSSFEVLVAVMLSAQTKDGVTYKTMQDLRAHGLSAQKIVDMPIERLTKLVGKVNYHRRKAVYMKKTSQLLLEKYSGSVPDQLCQLLELPGVGEKTALLYLQVAKGKVEGIAVDTHVHRIANALGWTGSPTKTAQQTRRQLEKRIPRRMWGMINPLVVGFGQELRENRSELLRKCLASSNPRLALQLLADCGMKVQREMEKAGLETQDYAG
ncbi:nth-1 [Symbiodinium necroappetens]|uniref:Nth-1 protein n=1 Tax=Symbiodinium necroappetens TaxID=1628268 RepID=A0A812YXA0_9DINO|nr:nth-1 [Symbiodinium necroappetens]